MYLSNGCNLTNPGNKGSHYFSTKQDYNPATGVIILCNNIQYVNQRAVDNKCTQKGKEKESGNLRSSCFLQILNRMLLSAAL